ncbi:MAG: hypothetical protein M3386_04340 [Actinomycetota bacterium]|nr:hypothetical protein [Nocardioidaceae bacterium]MDQ3592117.1 hypothetical protein [Actinomycetota bacterium]
MSPVSRGDVECQRTAQERNVIRQPWPLRQVRLVMVGFGNWYVTYVAFRNPKSFVPFVRNGRRLRTARRVRVAREVAVSSTPA